MTKTEVGYPEGGKKYKEAPGKVGQDPRANIITNDFTPGQKIDKGTKVTVKGVGKARKQTATWF